MEINDVPQMDVTTEQKTNCLNLKPVDMADACNCLIPIKYQAGQYHITEVDDNGICKHCGYYSITIQRRKTRRVRKARKKIGTEKIRI